MGNGCELVSFTSSLSLLNMVLLTSFSTMWDQLDFIQMSKPKSVCLLVSFFWSICLAPLSSQTFYMFVLNFPYISCNGLLSCALNQPRQPANKSQGWGTLALFSQRCWRVEITPWKSMLLSFSLLQSQQKCIVIFALVCCFAVLVALIFSAVDIWGEDEDGITEDNCSKNCRWELQNHKLKIYCQWFPVFLDCSPSSTVMACSY